MKNQPKMSKNSKKRSAAKPLHILGIIASLALFFTTPHSAQADSADTDALHQQEISYQLYAGGINAVKANLIISYPDEDHYSLMLEAKTKGFLSRLVPWHGSFGTEGWRNGGAEKPRKHESISVWRDEEEIKTYRYEKDGSFLGLKITEDGKDKSPKDLPDDLVQQTTDALTATLHMMDKVAAGEDCEGKSEVFDGKRRFVLKFNHEEDVMLEKSRYNNYSGKAARCSVEVIPMTGAWYKKPRGWLSIQEQGREKGTLPTVWFAPITQNGPAVPVKMRIKTDYGTLFMHMADYQTDSALRDDNLVTAKADLKDE